MRFGSLGDFDLVENLLEHFPVIVRAARNIVFLFDVAHEDVGLQGVVEEHEVVDDKKHYKALAYHEELDPVVIGVNVEPGDVAGGGCGGVHGHDEGQWEWREPVENLERGHDLYAAANEVHKVTKLVQCLNAFCMGRTLNFDQVESIGLQRKTDSESHF